MVFGICSSMVMGTASHSRKCNTFTVGNKLKNELNTIRNVSGIVWEGWKQERRDWGGRGDKVRKVPNDEKPGEHGKAKEKKKEAKSRLTNSVIDKLQNYLGIALRSNWRCKGNTECNISEFISCCLIGRLWLLDILPKTIRFMVPTWSRYLE